jgi:hypothetical protein
MAGIPLYEIVDKPGTGAGKQSEYRIAKTLGAIARPKLLLSPQVLIPFDVAEAICLKDAAARAGKGQTTVRNWCRDHHIGRRVGGGTWMVSQVALAMFLDGDSESVTGLFGGRPLERTGEAIL